MDIKKLKKKLKKAIKTADTLTNEMIEIADYEYDRGRDVDIIIEHKEFTSLCPRTGLPDFGNITIRYTPDKRIIELRSLKFYFLQYRNVGIFYEHIVNRILDDLIPLVEPVSMEIVGQFNIRGGITTTVKALYTSPEGEKAILPADTKGPDPRD